MFRQYIAHCSSLTASSRRVLPLVATSSASSASASAVDCPVHFPLHTICSHVSNGSNTFLRSLSSSAHVFASVACTTPCRALHTVTTAANFDVEVIQSQQAICAVYYIPNHSSCSAYLKTAEKLVDEFNRMVSVVVEEAPASARQQPQTDRNLPEEDVVIDDSLVAGDNRAAPISQSTGTLIEVDFVNDSNSAKSDQMVGRASATAKSHAWLKLCVINADENRNLASAFSVERAKLPLTYFVMQGTIIDKVAGHISETRLRAILQNFLEHYQQQMNVDLMAKSSARYNQTGGAASPLPSAEKADLLHAGASSQYIKDKILSSLVGSDRISLPEESSHLDGLRTLVQDGKKKAHAELQDLFKQLGMDVRRLSDNEMHKHYYQSKQFVTMGVISALEALFLAREFAAIGDISRDNVEWAQRAVRKDFEPILGQHEMRKVLALVDANVLRGDLQLALRSLTVEMQSLLSSLQAAAQAESESSDMKNASSPACIAMQQRCQTLQQHLEYTQKLIGVIDNNVDARVLETAFPSAVVDDLFEELKACRKQLRSAPRHQNEQGDSDRDEKSGQGTAPHTMAERRGGREAEMRMQQVKTVIMCVLQMYPTDAKSQMARSRLSSLLF